MRNIVKTGAVLAVAAVMGISDASGAEEKLLPRIPSKPVRVALFKNGLGFIEREAQIPRGAADGELGLFPVPVHGTLWAHSKTPGVELKNIIAGSVPVEEEGGERDALSIAELIDANDGRELELVVIGASGQPETLKAKVRALRGRKPAGPAASAAESGFGASLDTAPSPTAAARWPHLSSVWQPPQPPAAPPPVAAELLLLETEEGQRVIERSAVRQVRGRNLRLRVQDPPVRRTRPSLRVSVTGNDKGATLGISYLAKGITWAPSYQIEMLDDKTVRLHCKAQILNDLEDIEGARISVIAGFPNLQFSHVNDPMAFRGNMLAWLQSLTAPAGGPMRREAVMTQQAVMFNVASADGMDMRADFDPAAFAGRGDSDLFFYEMNDVSLKQGERGYFPLFTAESPYESVYDCRIGQGKQTPGSRGEEFSEDVWHALRLSNRSKQPWTTAPATVLRNGLILGQDTLYFTSLGSRTLLRFTKALDVRASSVEKEIERQRNVPHRGTSWDLVTAEGTISLVNLKPVEVMVIVQRTVEGEISANPSDGKLELAQAGITAVNPTSNLSWEVRIPPRKSVNLSYTYKRYVR